MAEFLDRHPETVAAMKIIKQKPPSAGFADSAFYGLNAFYFTNSAGATVPVRWSLVPLAGMQPPASSPGKDYLFDDLIRTVAKGPVAWRLVITVGEPGDPTNDATKPWPPSRRTVDAGTVTISAVQTRNRATRATSTSTRWCCRTVSPPPTIPSPRRGRPCMPARSPAAPKNPSRRARSTSRRCSDDRREKTAPTRSPCRPGFCTG